MNGLNASDHFPCSCGAAVAAGADGTPAVCESCGKVYLPGSETPAVPLSQSLPARLSAWGCLLPVSLLSLLGVINALLLAQQALAVKLALVFTAALLGFGWLIKQNRYSKRTVVCTVSACTLVIGGFTASMWQNHRRQVALDACFEPRLKEVGQWARKLQSSAGLKPRCLPVVLQERGAYANSSTPHISRELYEALPAELRAAGPEDVQTVIVVEWWYHQAGTYRRQDEFKEFMGNIYRGGCRIALVDRPSGTLFFEHNLASANQAPQERSGTDLSDWYGPQPTLEEVLAYLISLPVNR